VLHLLNHCGRGDSALYEQGLVNFFLDHVQRYDSLLITPAPDFERSLLASLDAGLERTLHESRYNLIAHPQSVRYQNSNQWLLEWLAAVHLGSDPSRSAAQYGLVASGYRADRIRIGRIRRLVGGLTQPNLDFLDHPLADRLRSRYSVVTVRSVVGWLEDQDLIAARIPVQAPTPFPDGDRSEREDHLGALPRAGSQGDATAVGAHDLTGQGQTDP